MTVTFFGHRDTPSAVYSILLKTITELIEEQNADFFYVGNEGNFDRMVRRILKMLSKEYPNMRYSVELAYLPWKKGKYNSEEDYNEASAFLELEKVPKRFAIDRRNRIMIDCADTVVTYVKHSYGGAAKFKDIAKKKGKMIIELANM